MSNQSEDPRQTQDPGKTLPLCWSEPRQDKDDGWTDGEDLG